MRTNHPKGRRVPDPLSYTIKRSAAPPLDYSNIPHGRISERAEVLEASVLRLLMAIDLDVPHGTTAVRTLDALAALSGLRKAAVRSGIGVLVAGAFITATRADVGGAVAWALHVLINEGGAA